MSELSSEELTEALNEYGLGELAERMGIKLIEVSANKTTGTMPVQGNRQPLGLLNGGANAILAETLGSIEANVAAYPDRVAVGVDINVTHHKGVKDGFVKGIATPLHVGKTTGSYLIEILNDKEERSASARLTVFFKEKNK
ncbi:MAG: hotdog fold thioesterase [Actinobacteria bacterium]|nr:hotdog fold thioesterase [Actinomycetota bacterium]